MTICLAAVCKNGHAIVCATDRMVTHGGLSVQFEHSEPKFTMLSAKCCAMTAGNALAHTEITEQVRRRVSVLRDVSVARIVATAKEEYCSARKEEVADRALRPRGIADVNRFLELQGRMSSELATAIQFDIDRFDLGVEMLVAGISEDGAHLYTVTNPGRSARYDALGFHAIGSGLPHATNSLIARGCNRRLGLQECVMVVSDAKIMAEKAPGVGKETDLVIMDMDSDSVLRLGPLDFDRLRLIREKWAKDTEGWSDELDDELTQLASGGRTRPAAGTSAGTGQSGGVQGES